MNQSRSLVLAVVVVMTVLFVVALNQGEPPLASLSGAAPAPTPLSMAAATAASVGTPVPVPCTAGTGIIRIGKQHPARAQALESLSVSCGCPKNEALRQPAAWHGHAITSGLQLTGSCSVVILRLGKPYRSIVGRIYVDDATGTTGGKIVFANAVVPSDSNTYQTVFENNIGYQKDNKVDFQAPLSGVGYLAIWEQCCTMQNTVVDIVATLE